MIASLASALPRQLRAVVIGLSVVVGSFGSAFVVGSVVVPKVSLPAVPGWAAPAVERPSWLVSSPTDRSIASRQERLRRAPDDLRAQAALGFGYLQKYRETSDPTYFSRADGILSQAYAQTPDDVQVLIGLAALAQGRHDFAEAFAWGERALGVSPGSATAKGIVAQAQVELGRYPEALATIQQMVDTRPNQASYGLVSYARELYGDVPGAIAAMEMSISAGVPGAEGSEWSRVQLGHLYFGRGDLEAAEQTYQEALRLAPGYMYALAGRARVAAARGDYTTASALFRQAIEAAPLIDPVIRLAEVYRAAGRPEDAVRQEQLVRVQQQLYLANGVRTDVDFVLFDVDYGGDLAAAVAWGRDEWTRRPSIRVADTLAWALYRAGNCAEADTYAREALRLGTRDALLLFHAGRIAECAGDPGRAAALLSDALTLNPYFSVRYAPEARQALQELQRRAGGTP